MNKRSLNTLLLVFIISLITSMPSVYELTDKFIGKPVGIPYLKDDKPTKEGRVVHSFVNGLLFALLSAKLLK
jgi:hypothetical protein